MFDVRFGNDSVFERFLKGFQFAGMLGFSAFGPTFLPSDLVKSPTRLVVISCILVATRLALSVQYLVTAWASKAYKKSTPPLILHFVSCLAAAFLYGIMAIVFRRPVTRFGYGAWYLIAMVETIGTVAIAGRFKIAGFRETYLVERLSLLTLIILGEGIIVLMKSIQSVVEQGSIYSPATVGNIFSIGVIYYFLFMLYFDMLRKSYFGLVREGIWAFLHFPYHVALILFVEGINEIMISRRFIEEVQAFSASFGSIIFQPDTTVQFVGESIQTLIQAVERNFPGNYAKHRDIDMAYAAISKLTSNTTYSVSMLENPDVTTAYAYGVDLMFLALGLQQSKAGQALPLIERIKIDFELFQLIFGYLFITGGVILLFMAGLSYLNKTHQTRLGRLDWLNIAVHVVVGIGLALMSIMLVTRNNRETPYTWTLTTFLENPHEPPTGRVLARFFLSSWVLPTIVFCYLIVFLVSVVVLMSTTHLNRNLKGVSRPLNRRDMEANDTSGSVNVSL
ncbi:MAG: hypothetical protein M1814_005016 [Vezdaea aestivalis]|nr:MAG: hypothetical protein M1814_005016 [Vezdaea aestivalis]